MNLEMIGRMDPSPGLSPRRGEELLPTRVAGAQASEENGTRAASIGRQKPPVVNRAPSPLAGRKRSAPFVPLDWTVRPVKTG